jgi:hypothetical protein
MMDDCGYSTPAHLNRASGRRPVVHRRPAVVRARLAALISSNAPPTSLISSLAGRPADRERVRVAAAQRPDRASTCPGRLLHERVVGGDRPVLRSAAGSCPAASPAAAPAPRRSARRSRRTASRSFPKCSAPPWWPAGILPPRVRWSSPWKRMPWPPGIGRTTSPCAINLLTTWCGHGSFAT